jgi:plasmid maintenance system antidote protein VapI
LIDEYLALDVAQHRLAIAIRVPPRRINEIVHADTALRMARYFGTSERIWMNRKAVTT